MYKNKIKKCDTGDIIDYSNIPLDYTLPWDVTGVGMAGDGSFNWAEAIRARSPYVSASQGTSGVKTTPVETPLQNQTDPTKKKSSLGQYLSGTTTANGGWQSKNGSLNVSYGGMQALSAAGNLTSGLVKGQSEQQQAIRSGLTSAVVSTGNPFAIAAVMAGNLLDATIGTPDYMSNDIAKRYGVSGIAKFSNTASSIPGLGWMLRPFAGKIDKAKNSYLVDQNRVDYGGVAANMDAAKAVGGNHYLAARRINAQQRESNRQTEIANDILKEGKLRQNNQMADLLNSRNQIKYSGGQQVYSLSAKKGMKLPELEEARRILQKKSEKEVEKFQNGGKVDPTKNLIPSGSLHAHLNHIDETDPNLKDQITRKGVPVVSIGEGGEITQHAEVEKEELTLTKSVTNEIEQLFERYKNASDEEKDQIAIECGRFITNEVLFNTDDRSGLIDKVEE